MRRTLLAAVAALGLAMPAAAQMSAPQSDPPMPVAPPGLGERIVGGTDVSGWTMPGETQSSAIIANRLSTGQIRQIQQALRAQGYTIRRVDGVWGRETAGAVAAFQLRQNIAGVPGVVDAETLSRLGVAPSAFAARPGRAVPGSGLPSAAPGLGGVGSMPLEPSPGAFGGLQVSPVPSPAPGTGLSGGGSRGFANDGSHPESSFGSPSITVRPPSQRSMR